MPLNMFQTLLDQLYSTLLFYKHYKKFLLLKNHTPFIFVEKRLMKIALAIAQEKQYQIPLKSQFCQNIFSARRAYFENTFCKSVIRVLLMNTLPRERISYILWICLWLPYTEGSWKGIVLTKLYSFKLNSIQRKSIEHNLGSAIINHIFSNSLYKLILQILYSAFW